MTGANISLAQSLYAAFGRGDIATVVATMAGDVSWQVVGRPQDYPIFGARKGPQAVHKFFRLVGESQETVSFTPREFHAAGDMVFVLGRYAWTPRKTGKPVDAEWVHVFTIKNGKVTAFREFTDTAQFAAAFRG